jgi:hypothetical protein
MDAELRKLQREGVYDEIAFHRWAYREASLLIGHFQQIWDIVRFVSKLCGGKGLDSSRMKGPNPFWGQMESEEIWLIQNSTGMPRDITTPLGIWEIDIPATVIPTRQWLPTLIERFEMLPIWGELNFNEYTNQTELIGTAEKGELYIGDFSGACGPIWLLQKDLDGYPLPRRENSIEENGVVQANITPISGWALVKPRTNMYYSYEEAKKLWEIIQSNLCPPTSK